MVFPTRVFSLTINCDSPFGTAAGKEPNAVFLVKEIGTTKVNANGAEVVVLAVPAGTLAA
jgi:hypothetical protein